MTASNAPYKERMAQINNKFEHPLFKVMKGTKYMSKFRLERLKINHHKREIFDVQFIDQNNSPNNDDKIFTTLILGVNGSGKSYLLTIVANIFIFLEKAQNYKRKPKFRYDEFLVGYQIDGHQYEVSRISGKEIICFCNGRAITLEKLELPPKILAVSFLVNDKFLFAKPETRNSLQAYTYLGVRKTSNATYTSSIIQNVMSNIFQIIFSELYSEFVTILSLMKFDNKIQVNFTQGISSKIADDYLDKLLGNKTWQSPLIIDFTNNSDATLFFIRDNKDKILSYYNSGMLELSNIAFYKNGDLIPFEDCSSGEKHLIFSLSGILCHIKPNSLVLIDEPEISLHPEWQTRYIDLIKTIFQEYSSCHFLIASHSHYLVSDLEPSTSSIVSMNRTISETSPHAELLPYSTYAWSAENVIYNIFGVRTTRNFYFEADLRKLIDLMNSDDGTGSNVDEVHSLVSKLKKLIFDESDPLNIILNQAQEFCNVYKKNRF